MIRDHNNSTLQKQKTKPVTLSDSVCVPNCCPLALSLSYLSPVFLCTCGYGGGALYLPDCLPACLSVCPSVRPSVRLSVRPSVHPSVHPSVRPSVKASLSHQYVGCSPACLTVASLQAHKGALLA